MHTFMGMETRGEMSPMEREDGPMGLERHEVEPPTDLESDEAADKALLAEHTYETLNAMTELELDDFLNNTLKTDAGRMEAAKILRLDTLQI